jgi:hypothetical protein
MKVFAHFNLNYYKAKSGENWPGHAPISSNDALKRKFYSVKKYGGNPATFSAPGLKLVRALGDKGVVDGLILCNATVSLDNRMQREIWRRAAEADSEVGRLVCCGVSGTLLAAWNPYSLPDLANPADVAAAAGISVPRDIERISYYPFSENSPNFFWATREGRPIFESACLVVCCPTGVFAMPQAARGQMSLGRLYQIG